MIEENYRLVTLAALIIISSLLELLANFFIYQFPANNYFPDGTLGLALILILFYLGLVLLVGKNNKITQISRELICLYLVMSLVALASNAVQLTPFPTIDSKIMAFEAIFNIHIDSLLEWTNTHSNVDNLLRILYDSLSYQMFYIPFLIILMGKFKLLREYYFLLLLTTLIGFNFYYFFPTTAPASMIYSPYFNSYQIATGLKFEEIHRHIPPSTIEGGLIAFPSFHCIWALLCVYLLKEWKIACTFLFLMNMILISSCVLLGWHYPSDIIAGVLLFVFSYYALKRTQLNKVEHTQLQLNSF